MICKEIMYNNDLIILIIVFGIALILNIIAEALDIQVLRWYTKPLLIPLLIAYYVVQSREADLFIVFALISAFAGDIFLLFSENKIMLKLGLLSFLIGHILFSCFILSSLDWLNDLSGIYWLFIIPYLGVGTIVFLFLQKSLENMKFLAAIYILGLISMAFFCTLRISAFSGPALWFPVIGSFFFISSDFVLSYILFKKKIKWGGAFVMLSYIIAEVLLVLGFMTT
jgi:uncharacterized membrane protein YhhN